MERFHIVVLGLFGVLSACSAGADDESVDEGVEQSEAEQNACHCTHGSTSTSSGTTPSPVPTSKPTPPVRYHCSWINYTGRTYHDFQYWGGHEQCHCVPSTARIGWCERPGPSLKYGETQEQHDKAWTDYNACRAAAEAECRSK